YHYLDMSSTFFLHPTHTLDLYTLSLHDALPIFETRRIPASSSFISSRFSSLKLVSPKFELSSFCRSVSVTEPFFPRNSTMARDIGLGLHILFNDGVRTRDSIQSRLGYCEGGSFFLESLAETFVPVLHIRSNRGLYAFHGISKVL